MVNTRGAFDMGQGFGQMGDRRDETAQNQNISVRLNGQRLTFDQNPVIENNRTFVPLRGIFEALGITVTWDADSQTITAANEKTTVVLTVGSSTAYKNGIEITMDVSPKILGERTMVPVRFLSESFDLRVGWDEATNTVLIDN